MAARDNLGNAVGEKCTAEETGPVLPSGGIPTRLLEPQPPAASPGPSLPSFPTATCPRHRTLPHRGLPTCTGPSEC